MAKTKEFENILNECLDRLINGESIDSCLARYPQYTAELAPLLKTAQATRQAAAISPRPEFRQRAGNEFQAAIRNLPAKKERGVFHWRVSWVAPVVVLLALIAAGGGTVAAATNALPDNPLYQVKLATESVRMVFTFSNQGKAELYSKFVDYRVEEIARMAEEGKYTQLEQITQRMNSQLLAMADVDSSLASHGEKVALYGQIAVGGDGTRGPLSTVPQVPPATTTTAATTKPGTTTTVAAPTTAAVPAPSVTVAVPTTTAPPSPSIGNRNNYTDDNVLSDIDKLRQLLTERYQQNLQILEAQLEKAPDALKPALQKAIEVLEQGYAQAIANLS